MSDTGDDAAGTCAHRGGAAAHARRTPSGARAGGTLHRGGRCTVGRERGRAGPSRRLPARPRPRRPRAPGGERDRLSGPVCRRDPPDEPARRGGVHGSRSRRRERLCDTEPRSCAPAARRPGRSSWRAGCATQVRVEVARRGEDARAQTLVRPGRQGPRIAHDARVGGRGVAAALGEHVGDRNSARGRARHGPPPCRLRRTQARGGDARRGRRAPHGGAPQPPLRPRSSSRSRDRRPRLPAPTSHGASSPTRRERRRASCRAASAGSQGG